MLAIRSSDERGRAEAGWLSSRHSFSFGHYQDPKHMGFRALRVINEDRVVPGAGFPEHSHEDMEIISYVLAGALEHRDSLGSGAVIRPGEIQRMSAGSGIRHSEFNASRSEPVHFLQIWILPNEGAIEPSYEQQSLPPVAPGESRLDPIGSPDGKEGGVTIHQDVRLYRGVLASGEPLDLPLASDRHAWVQVARGNARVCGQELREGDGLAISDVRSVTLSSSTSAELLVFDLA